MVVPVQKKVVLEVAYYFVQLLFLLLVYLIYLQERKMKIKCILFCVSDIIPLSACNSLDGKEATLGNNRAHLCKMQTNTNNGNDNYCLVIVSVLANFEFNDTVIF